MYTRKENGPGLTPARVMLCLLAPRPRSEYG